MWWRLIGFFGSARALWAIIGLLVIAGGLFFKNQADGKTILKLQVASQQEAIRLLEGHMDRLDEIYRKRTEREVTQAVERQKALDELEGLRYEIPTIQKYADTPVPRELH